SLVPSASSLHPIYAVAPVSDHEQQTLPSRTYTPSVQPLSSLKAPVYASAGREVPTQAGLDFGSSQQPQRVEQSLSEFAVAGPSQVVPLTPRIASLHLQLSQTRQPSSPPYQPPVVGPSYVPQSGSW
ncbi:Hypothetical predicted protein, partial [Paramuricea clavata]